MSRRLKPGMRATKPEVEDCPHGRPGLVYRWVWNEARGGTEAESEPEVLEVPKGCHECNCDDPFCKRCWDD